MSDKYTPTTEDVRRAYQEHCRDYDAIDGLATSPESYEEEFNRWLERVIKAEAQVVTVEEIAGVLNDAGAQCGWCSREPGAPLSECESCYEVLNRYARAVHALLTEEEA